MQLRVYQSMWGMGALPGERGRWSVPEQVAAIRDAGWDGATIEIPDFGLARERAAALRDSGLPWVVACVPATVEDLKPIVEAVHELGREHCDHINLQPDVRPETVTLGIPYLLGWLEIAEDAGIPLRFETHRGRMTNDLRFTIQLIDAVAGVRLTADLSHYVVAGELPCPVPDEEQALIDRILASTSAFHGRVGSWQQIQVPTGFPQNSQWVELFLGWWERGFRSWRQRAGDDDTLIFTTELGPPPYAMTGADQRELSDRWDEAIWMKERVRAIWADIERDSP